MVASASSGLAGDDAGMTKPAAAMPISNRAAPGSSSWPMTCIRRFLKRLTLFAELTGQADRLASLIVTFLC